MNRTHRRSKTASSRVPFPRKHAACCVCCEIGFFCVQQPSETLTFVAQVILWQNLCLHYAVNTETHTGHGWVVSRSPRHWSESYESMRQKRQPIRASFFCCFYSRNQKSIFMRKTEMCECVQWPLCVCAVAKRVFLPQEQKNVVFFCFFFWWRKACAKKG